MAGSVGVPPGVGERADVDFSTTLKTYFNLYNLQFLCFAFLCLLVGGAYSVHIFERQYFINSSNLWDSIFAPSLPAGTVPNPQVYMPSPFIDFQSCIWFTIVTACSVGFGDMVPLSPGGRTVAGCIMLCGIFIASMLVGTITVLLSPTPFQTAVIDWLKADRLRHEKREIAACIIQTVFRDWRARKAERQRRIDSLAVPTLDAADTSAHGAQVVSVIADARGELVAGMRRRSVDLTSVAAAKAVVPSASDADGATAALPRPPHASLVASDSSTSLFPSGSHGAVELPNVVADADAADTETSTAPTKKLAFNAVPAAPLRAVTSTSSDNGRHVTSAAAGVNVSGRHDNMPTIKPILPFVHLPALKPLFRNLRHLKRCARFDVSFYRL